VIVSDGGEMDLFLARQKMQGIPESSGRKPSSCYKHLKE